MSIRTLFLIRHAKSSWDNPTLKDFQRALNDRGLSAAPQMAQILYQAGVRPDLIVTSPARRAIDTARFFGIQFGIIDDHFVPVNEIYEATPMDIMRVISQLPNEARTVFLFGHNPTFTEVANRFTTNIIDNIPTCGIVQLDSTAATWDALYERNTVVVNSWFPKLVL